MNIGTQPDWEGEREKEREKVQAQTWRQEQKEMGINSKIKYTVLSHDIIPKSISIYFT